MSEQGGLGQRLRALREERRATQKELGSALGVSSALISTWENDLSLPPPERLADYARIFATPGLVRKPAPRSSSDPLPDADQQRRQVLERELLALRGEAVETADDSLDGRLGGRFWHFRDQEPITILCTPLSHRQLGIKPGSGIESLAPAVQYAMNPTHPNVVRNLRNGDVDALLALVRHICAENPSAPVRWMTSDHELTADRLNGHVIVLGGVPESEGSGPAEPSALEDFIRLLDLPVAPVWSDTDDPDPLSVEFAGAFQVRLDESGRPDPRGTRREDFGPVFIVDEKASRDARDREQLLLVHGAPQLESDLMLLVRKPNPLRAEATVTILSGIFSRGTYGAVKTFTDEKLRAENEEWLYTTPTVGSASDFWLLVDVPVFRAKTTMTPQLSRNVRLGGG